ncbi:ATP-binding protein [Streptomyces monomycini]|uniref:ATP-binding protein n=1 Tax=Streptomyces monomycini TaxID=371720 RepID=UPI00067CF4C6|nr:BTAD domain-containing putative transcriptional regulator [Streptomyces monomycini]
MPSHPAATAPDEPLLRVLGPVSARHGGRTLTLGPPLRRALLSLLLVRLGRVVPQDLLVEELWPREPPARPVAALQSHVSHLRRALRPVADAAGPPVLLHRASGYVLELEPEQTDVHRFERLVAAGRRRLEQRDPRGADQRLAAALGLWRGSPYAEFDAYPPLRDEQHRLEQIRLTAVEAHAQTRLTLGRPAEVAADLEPEARAHPARERLVGHLMHALHRLGRRAEALEVYERTRGHLVSEFGVDTAAELRRTRAAIVRQEPGDDGPAGPPRPVRDAEPPPATAGDAAPALPESQARPDGGPAADGREAPAPPAEGPAADEGHDAGCPAGALPFTGRHRELRRLTTAALAARDGHGQVTGVFGPAGMGKTRLLLELAPWLEDTPAGGDGTAPEGVWGHCFPGEGMPPYWLWTQVLRRLSATRSAAFDEAARPFGALLGPLLPERTGTLGERPGFPSDWEHARFLVHDAVCEILLTLAGQRPLVLLLEDLHWADSASLDLLRLLSTRGQGHPLSIVLTGREFEVESDATLRRTLAEILRGPWSGTVRLDGLSRESVASLVRAQAGREVPAEVVEVLHRRSGGNPYFVAQLLSLLGDARRLHRPDAVEVLLARVPTGVREVLHQRFAALPEPVLAVLRLCAVIGSEVDTDLLHRVADADEPVGSALESAMDAGLLDEDPRHPGQLHFAHALVRETLVDDLGSEARQRLHARVAEVLAARGHGRITGQETERVAHHTWQARSILPAGRMLPRLMRAAEHAEQHLAYEQRETWLRRAIHLNGFLPPDRPATVRLEQQLHIQLGQALATTRGYGHPEAERALAHGRALRAVTRTPEDPSVLWALCAAYLVTGRYEESREFSGLLREIAEQRGEPVALLGAAYGEGIVLHVRGLLPEALTELERAVGLADRFAREDHALARTFQHDPRVSCRSYDAFTHWLLGDHRAAGRRRRELLSLTANGSRPSDRSFALYVDAVVAAWEGDARTAHRSGSEGARLAGEHGLRYWEAMLGLLDGWALSHLGQADDGLSRMHSCLTELDGSRTHLRQALHLGLLGQAQHHAGRPQEAAATFRSLLSAVESHQEQAYLSMALPTTRLLHELLH